MAEITKKYTFSECLNTFNTFDLEFSMEAIRYLANKNTSIERLMLNPDSDSMSLLLIAGTEDNDEKLASAHYKSWVVGHRFSIEDFLYVVLYKLWGTWGFFRSSKETGVLKEIEEKMGDHVVLQNMKLQNQKADMKVHMHMKSLLEENLEM